MVFFLFKKNRIGASHSQTWGRFSPHDFVWTSSLMYQFLILCCGFYGIQILNTTEWPKPKEKSNPSVSNNHVGDSSCVLIMSWSFHLVALSKPSLFSPVAYLYSTENTKQKVFRFTIRRPESLFSSFELPTSFVEIENGYL